jgi:3',5'-cyclic-AMP phosphodiesterase
LIANFLYENNYNKLKIIGVKECEAPMNRRAFVAGGLSSVIAKNFLSREGADFSFVHFTDVHIEDELQAGIYTRRCFEQINRHNPAFSISGGDLVFDANAVSKERAEHLFELYA